MAAGFLLSTRSMQITRPPNMQITAAAPQLGRRRRRRRRVCVCVRVSVVQRRLHTWSLRPSFVFSFIFFCLSSFPMLSNNSDDSKTRLERKVKTRLENHSLFFFLLPSLRIASWCEKVLFSTLYLFLFFSVVFCGAEIRKFRRRRMKWE